ncbi:MAG: hypothetical protein FJ207_09855 [Gemmatimonadetes bacterium]|nr:hypothetical protein [Gemmatimonadota bacterium]
MRRVLAGWLAPVLGSALGALPAMAAAQAPTIPLADGQRVQLATTIVAGRFVGQVVALDDRSVTLRPESRGVGDVRIPLAEVMSAEVSLGRRRHTLKGALVGGGLGLPLGLLWDVDPTDCGYDSSKWCSRGDALAGAMLTGMLLGAILGWMDRDDAWAPITLEVPHAVTSPSQWGVALRIPFTP